MFKFGKNKVDKIVDGRIERRHFFQVTLVAVDLLAVVQPFFSAAARIDEKLWGNGLVLFLLHCCSFPLLRGYHAAVHLLLWKERELLSVLLGFLKKLLVILQQDLKYPVLAQLTAQFHQTAIQFPPDATVLCTLVLLGQGLDVLEMVMKRGILPGTQVQNIRGQFPGIKQCSTVFDCAAVNVKYDISIQRTSPPPKIVPPGK